MLFSFEDSLLILLLTSTTSLKLLVSLKHSTLLVEALEPKSVGRIYTANESPLDKRIPFYHEMAYSPNFPTKLFLFCEVEPGSGGQTPIVLSHIVYEKMKEKHPEFVAQLEEHGWKHSRVISGEGNPLSIGRGWKSIYKTDDKNVAEERAAKLGIKLEWVGDAAKTISVPMPAIRFDEESQRKTWFNGLAMSYSGPASEKIHNENTSAQLGNGDPVPDYVMEDLYRILEEECVAIPWKKGDVMLINNLTVLHSRQPLIKPPRRILVSLCN